MDRKKHIIFISVGISIGIALSIGRCFYLMDTHHSSFDDIIFVNILGSVPYALVILLLFNKNVVIPGILLGINLLLAVGMYFFYDTTGQSELSLVLVPISQVVISVILLVIIFVLLGIGSLTNGKRDVKG